MGAGRRERQATARLEVKRLGETDYASCLARMRAFTQERDERTADQLWLTSHPPVFTLGQAGRKEHLLSPGDIAVIQTDRGGQVTYHGPGQLIAYVLIDLRRRDYGVRSLVRRLEDGTIATLAACGLACARRAGMPGVYTSEGAKIAALGLRVRRGCSYHGISLNLDCDLAPYARIDPCGYPDLAVTSLRNEKVGFERAKLAKRWAAELARSIATSG